jgi:hypothetical protein
MTDLLETTDLIDPWLYSTLAGDSVIQSLVGSRISNTQSTDELAAPYITFSSSAARAIRGVGGTLLDVDAQYQIKAVSQSGSFNQASAIAARIRTLLDQRSVTTASPLTPVPSTIACWWELEIRYPELSEGNWYRHLGAQYRIRATVL